MELLEGKVLNAIRQSQYQQLDLFLRHKYNIHAMTRDGRNGLFIALDIANPRKRRRMIRFCLDHGLNPLHKEHTHGYTPLHEAVARQQLDSVQLLLANVGGELDWRSFDRHGRTILHQAVECNNVAILEALVNIASHYGVSVDIPDSNGLTPFLLARKLHLPGMSQILLDRGHASQQQCDLPSHRTAKDWQIIGLEEQRLSARDRIRHEIEQAMQAGKINRVNQLRRVYCSPLLSPANASLCHPTAALSLPIFSDVHNQSTMSTNEPNDRLFDGELSKSFAASDLDEQTYPSSLPPLARQRRTNRPMNALVDLFQVATEQFSPSYRSSIQANSNDSFEHYARKKSSAGSHRGLGDTLKSRSDSGAQSRRRRPSNIVLPPKRVT